MLTKTAYLAYGQCPKNFWLSQHRPELAAPPDPATQRRLRAGQEVDQCAREQFPHGRLIPYRPHPTDMATLTVQILAEGVETLFQATFIVDDLLVKADILTYDDNGRHLIEVKSGTGYKKAEHLLDVAFQVHVLRSSGLDVTRAGVMHLNSHCRHPDLSNLFTLTDVTDDVWAFLPQVEADVINMRGLVAQTETPELSIGRHCARPYPCPFYNHCWQDVKEWTIYDIPYLKPPLEQQLEAEGVRYVTDVPSGFKLGDKRAAAFVARIRHRQVEIDAAAIGAELDSLVYPLYFFDFETIDYAIPIYAGCTPYQQVPFQYSCHILEENGSLIHCDYLHTTTGDPRPQLVESLLGHIGETGHLVAYNSSFEGGILRHLAAHFPGRADPLAQMADRLWDQLAIIRRHYRHHGFGKSNSLKSVLPVVVPRLSYETLAVQDGAQAQVVWEEMIGCQDTTTKSRLAEQLKGYCYLDTLAMVEIHQELSTL